MSVYISTYTVGFEKVIKEQLPIILQGSEVLDVFSGLVVYRYSGNPMKISAVQMLNNSYHLIRVFSRKKTDFNKMVNEVIGTKNEYFDNRLLKIRCKTFRVRFTKENRFEKVDAKITVKAENEIVRATSLRIDRLNPQTEFWYIIRSENIAFYAQLLFKRSYTEKNLKKGELRPEFVQLLLQWAKLCPKDNIIDPFAGYGSIPLQICKYFKYGKLIINDNDKEKYQLLNRLFADSQKSGNTAVMCKDALDLNWIDEKSIDKVITDPPWGIYEKIDDIGLFYLQVLAELKRIIKDDGIILVLSARKEEFENAVFQNKLKIVDKIDTLVNGKKASIFKVVK